MDDRPILDDEWKQYEIEGFVDKDAENISIGFMLTGVGKVWADDFQFFVKENNKWKEVDIENPGFKSDEIGRQPKDFNNESNLYTAKVVYRTPAKKNKCVLIVSKPPTPPKKLFDEKTDIGEIISEKIGCGLSCIVPLALYTDKEHTYPITNLNNLNSLKNNLDHMVQSEASGDDLYVRLAGVIIAWNVFQHFYPYFDVVKTDWRQELKKALDSAFQDKDKFDYLKTLNKMVAGLKDGHAVAYFRKPLKSYYPSFCWAFAGDQLVIEECFDPSLDVLPGDVVLEINGKKTLDALKDESQYISAPTKGWLNCILLRTLLRGDKGAELKLKILRNDKILERVALHNLERREFYDQKKINKPHHRKINDGIYYLNIGRISSEKIEELLPELKKAKAIICDLRGYPRSNVRLIQCLLKEDDKIDDWMRIPKIIYPDFQKVTYKNLGWNLKKAEPHLSAKIIFIIDGRAISYAESYMGYIEGYKLATIIGQPTAGTNGNVNVIFLPGQYQIYWTGMRVVKHDGSQHHGVGIIPDILVERTVEGIKEGRDEFLEKAIEIARENTGKEK